MSFAFPQFLEHTPIDAQRSWTASFECYDQHCDDSYYWVSVHEAGRPVTPFMVQVGLYWAGDDWTGPDFLVRLQQELHRVAVTGQTNTSYAGTRGAR